MRKEFNRMSWVFSWYSGCPQRECWQGGLGLVPNLHGLSPYWPTVARSMCSSFVISHRWLSEALLYTKPPTRSCWGNSFAGVASRLLSTSIRTTITTLLIYLLTDLNCVNTVKYISCTCTLHWNLKISLVCWNCNWGILHAYARSVSKLNSEPTFFNLKERRIGSPCARGPVRIGISTLLLIFSVFSQLNKYANRIQLSNSAYP
jgi:hypothetical protein